MTSASGTCLSNEEMRREGSRFERLELFTLRNVGQIAARQVELIKSCRPFSLGRRLFFFFIYLVFESTAYIPPLKYDCYHLLVVTSYTPDVQLFAITSMRVIYQCSWLFGGNICEGF